MRTIIVRRLALGLLLLWLASVLVFTVTQLLPGDAARALLGRFATPAGLQALRVQMHLDEPPVVQYWDWLSGLVTGHWGTSLISGQPVLSVVAYRAGNTAILVVVASVIATPLAIAVGTLSATRGEGWLDHGLSLATLSLAALPAFVIGIGLIYLLATNVTQLLPPASIVNPAIPTLRQPSLIVLPSLTLALAVIPYATRMIRASMVEVLRSDYVMMARLKGLPERTVVVRHALRNAIAPTIQATALNLLFMAGGVVVVETLFSYPGVGSALAEAVGERDIPMVQTLTVLLAAFCVVVNLAADLLVIMVTPRLRTRL